MQVIRLPMPCEPWGANQTPRTVRDRIAQHHRKTAVRDTVDLVARSHFRQHARSGQIPLGPSMVHVTIPFSTNRRRDPHNYTSTVVKAVIDGLRAAGVFADDTPDHLSVVDPTLIVGDTLTITIRPRTVREYP